MSQVYLKDNMLSLSGNINFDNARDIYQQGLNELKNIQHWPIVIDLSAVEQANTLLLAIILQWLKQCSSLDSLKIGAMPAKMQGILDASHLEHLKAV